MPLVNCVLHGDGDEAGSKVSFFAPAPVTLASLHRLFPYEGTFHFRLRLDGARHLGLKAPAPGDPCYVWLDLTEALCGEFASALSGESVEVQALFLALPEQPVDGTAQYLAHYDDVHDEVCQLDQRPDRYPVVGAKKGKDGRGGSGSGSGSGVVRQTADVLKFISRGARDGLKQGVSAVKQQQQSLGASLMGFTKSVFNGLQKTADITAVAEDNLTQLSDDASTAFNDKNSVHVSVLLNLWEVLFPQGGPYQRTSETWRTAGFQKPDPVLDLKATGILALRAMTYLCHKFPVKAQAMLKKNQANVKANYPFAIVGINLTLLLIDLLALREQKYLTTNAKYWSTFEDDAAFFELFCIAFLHMDHIWAAQGAVRTDFGRLIGEVKGALGQVLARSPTSTTEMRRYAQIEGLVDGIDMDTDHGQD